ncbi:hypothetical protein PoB_000228300, partial [Plakobranchus ocellatus]
MVVKVVPFVAVVLFVVVVVAAVVVAVSAVAQEERNDGCNHEWALPPKQPNLYDTCPRFSFPFYIKANEDFEPCQLQASSLQNRCSEAKGTSMPHPLSPVVTSQRLGRQKHKLGNAMSSSSPSSTCTTYVPSHCLNQSRVREQYAGPTCSISPRPIRSRVPLRGLAFLLFGTFVLVAVAVGVSKIRAKPTLHVVFPASDVVRKVRMFSDFPDLSLLFKNHSSLSLVSRLQLLDTKRCRDQLQACKMSIVCDPATDQGVNCRCRRGYYFSEWKCNECSNHCPHGHYLVSSCATNADAICRPCTTCGKTQYVAAPCNTHRDTMCVDVSFPVGILPMKRSHLPDDRLRISVRHSPNVFLERLADMTSLETPMYVTNNQQSLHFVWDRPSGLNVAVQVTDVLLVPEYRDVDAQDDTGLFNKLQTPTKLAKQYYTDVQDDYCRHPVPDYYSLQLLLANITSAARVVRCDSTDSSVPSCPSHYKDGDRYLQWDIKKPCPMLKKEKQPSVERNFNTIICTEETPLLRQVFGLQRPTTREFRFPLRDCQQQEQACKECLDTAPCPEGIRIRNYTESYLHDNRCCGIHCYSKPSCQRAFSAGCPDPTVECAEGEINKFLLSPHFSTIEDQFACHLQYHPPAQLYTLSYSIQVPSIGLNISEKHFTVSATSREDHRRRVSRLDFIQAVHDTRFPVKEEIILLGDHLELSLHDSLMKPYSVRGLKTPEELARQTRYTRDIYNNMAFIQFERPFLYSSSNWKRDGCQKNVSQIYPNQTIYSDETMPVMARKSKVTFSNSNSKTKEFSYQLYYTEREPFVKFYVDAGESVLQHLQGTAVHGILVPSSLYGRVTWHHASSSWQLLFAGRQLNCPTVISLKIFTQMMTGCAGHFDILINCPEDFTVTFNLTTAKSDLPDVFVLQANDSRTSHNLVLSSLYSPIHVDELGGRSQVELSQKLGEVMARRKADGVQGKAQGSQFILRVWWPLLVVVAVALVLLLAIYGCYSYINANIPRIDYKTAAAAGNSSTNTANAAANSSGNSNLIGGGNGEPPVVVVALNNQGEKANHITTTTTTITSTKDKTEAPKAGKTKSKDNQENEPTSPRGLIIVFVILYIIYSLVFSFSVTFGALYLTQFNVWSNVSNPENLAQELHIEVDRSLSEIREFEKTESERIFSSFLERRRACVNHLEMENSRLLEDYDATMRKQQHSIFEKNGTLHLFTAQIQRQNVSAYIRQINQFLEDCNKTVHSIVDRFEANYFQFLRNMTLNNWLEVPRQIFLFESGEDIYSQSLSSTQVKQFASWLAIDKVDVLLKARDNVFGRLSSVTLPQVTALDMTFPSAHPAPPVTSLPTIFDSEYQTFSYVPLDPPNPLASSVDLEVQKLNVSTLDTVPPAFTALKGYPSLMARYRRETGEVGVASLAKSSAAAAAAAAATAGRDGYDTFGLSGRLKANPDSSQFSGEISSSQEEDSLAGLDASSRTQNQVMSPEINQESAELDDSLVDGYSEDDDEEEEDGIEVEGEDFSESEETSNDGYRSEYRSSQASDRDESPVESMEPLPYTAKGEDGSDVAGLSRPGVKTETKVVNMESNLITDNHKQAARYDTVPLSPDQAQPQTQQEGSENKEGNSTSERWLYVLIAVFLTLDVILWAYRLSWLSRQLHAARHGYADRIPTDDACKQ